MANNEKPPVTRFQTMGRLLEDLTAPELYATTAPSFAIAAGVLTVTFASSRVDNSVIPPERRLVVIGRVSMPIPAVADMIAGLQDFLSNQAPASTPIERSKML